MNKLLLGYAVILVSLPVLSDGPANLCVSRGYTFAFFNGVWNTQGQANAGMKNLSVLRGASFQGQSVRYEAMYNHTGCESGTGAICVKGFSPEDIAEVFEQRAAEIDQSGELGKRWEYFWDSLNGDHSTTEKLVGLFPSAGNLFSALYTAVSAKLAAGVSQLFSNPPTSVDYEQHNQRLKTLAAQGQKLLLVAHSQGNLFANHAYDYIKPIIGIDSVKVVHIAPASPTLRGAHVLSDGDMVINALRVQGLSSVPPNNLMLPTSSTDLSGHTLIETYLNDTRTGLWAGRTMTAKAVVDELTEAAMRELQSPVARVSEGAFSVTMSWPEVGDMDLYVIEPNGEKVYYQHPYGASGHLQMDSRGPELPEYYAATCDAGQLLEGEYRIGFNNFGRSIPTSAQPVTFQVSSSVYGTLLTRSTDSGMPAGYMGYLNPNIVATVKVARDSATGHIVVNAF